MIKFRVRLAIAAVVLVPAVILAGCSPELGNSAGCMDTRGGYFPYSGEMVICRSGVDGSSVKYKREGNVVSIEIERSLEQEEQK